MVQWLASQGENMDLLFNSDIVNLLLKTSGGETEGLICYFCCLKCSDCQWVGGGGSEEKVLFRTTEILSLVSWFNSRMGKVR